MMKSGNFFANLPDASAGEIVENLAVPSGGKVERIISGGHASPPGFWYNQDTDEWVVLLKGTATLEEKDNPIATHLGPGDWLYIPAGHIHRVSETSKDAVWLAVHFNR